MLSCDWDCLPGIRGAISDDVNKKELVHKMFETVWSVHKIDYKTSQLTR